MRKLCCMALVCGFVFAMSGCGRTAGQEPNICKWGERNMKKTFGIVISLMILLTLAACGNTAGAGAQKGYSDSGTVYSEENQNTAQESGAEEQETEMSTKILVVYFSCTGTTRSLAEYAAEFLEADLYEIVPEEPYTEADLAYYTDGRADQEQNDPDSRPAISGGVENMDQYETIVIGYPIWHGQAPRIISTFLESYDFSGKTMVPFCTSHSSGIGSSADNLHALCPDTTVWAEGRRFEAGTSKDMIMEWLESVGIN